MTTLPPPDQEMPLNAMAEILAKLRAVRFVLWRSLISVDMEKRHLLSLPLEEQYDRFIEEDKNLKK